MMYVRDTLTLPAKGLRPSAHPLFRSPLASDPRQDALLPPGGYKPLHQSVTVTVAVMLVCTVQKYENVPTFVKVNS